MSQPPGRGDSGCLLAFEAGDLVLPRDTRGVLTEARTSTLKLLACLILNPALWRFQGARPTDHLPGWSPAHKSQQLSALALQGL